jgi:serine/threonine protein kinase
MPHALPSDSSSAELCGLPQRQPGAPVSLDPIERLATEYLDLLRSGTAPSIDAYVAQFPEWEPQIRELFPLIAALEDWKVDREQSVTRGPMPEQFNIPRLGDCQILREIGRGGMGVVFEAEQAPIGRRVAVKLLPWKFSERSRWRERFQQEARTVAALRHPHIVPVYSFGEHDGMCFYVMQLVEGVGLNRLIERLREGPGVVTTADIAADFRGGSPSLVPSPQSHGATGVLRRDNWKGMARIAVQAADTIRHAHRQGTLHRDIKPANLMIDVRGFVWVADFGLAVPMSALDQTTAAAGDSAGGPVTLAGTLRYMAPEQLQGQIDERCDLYAFGLTLYEMCVLRSAFQSTQRQELVEEILAANPPRPRKINSSVPRRLERIILTAIAADPAARYQRAEELIVDLRDYLSRGDWSLVWWPFGRRR